jgi:hypothetical protein
VSFTHDTRSRRSMAILGFLVIAAAIWWLAVDEDASFSAVRAIVRNVLRAIF